MPIRKKWMDHKVPETTQQKLAYINACQDWFAHTTEHQMPLENSCVKIIEVENKGDFVSNVFYEGNQLVCIGSAHVSNCINCNSDICANTLLAKSLNPFSNIHCFSCKNC